MYTLLLLVTTTPAVAGSPVLGDVYHPPHKDCYPHILARCARHCGLVISGVAPFYGKPGIPVSPGPTPAYAGYMKPFPPPLTAPAASTPSGNGQKSQ